MTQILIKFDMCQSNYEVLMGSLLNSSVHADAIRKYFSLKGNSPKIGTTKTLQSRCLLIIHSYSLCKNVRNNHLFSA